MTWCGIYASVNRISIGSDHGLSPIRRQAIIYTNAGLLSIRPLSTNFNEILIKKYKSFHSQKCIWKYRLRNGSHFVQGEMSLIINLWHILMFISFYKDGLVASSTYSLIIYIYPNANRFLFIHNRPLVSSNDWLAWSVSSLRQDGIITWKHFLFYWPFVRGIHKLL